MSTALLLKGAAKWDARQAELAELADPDPSWNDFTRREWEKLQRRKRKPSPAAGPRPVCTTLADKAKRITAYLNATPGAISGQGGHPHTIGVCGRVVRGFDLTPEEAFPFLDVWNQEKCREVWFEHELWHKIHDAHKHDHDTDPGPRGWLLDARQDPPAAGPRLRPSEDPALAEFFAYISGPPLEPVAFKDGCGKPAGVSTSASTESGQDQRDHTPDPAAERRRLVATIVGRQPDYRPCPRAVNRLMEGCHPTTIGADLVVRVRCKCWTCYVCRERRRTAEKRKNVPFAMEHGTHVFRGTEKQWAAYRKRMARAGQVAGAYRIVQTAGVVVVLSAHTPDDLPEHPGLCRVAGEDAARALGAAVDAVPDELELEPGRERVKPFTKNGNWLVGEDDDEGDADTSFAEAAHVEAPPAGEVTAPAPPLCYFRAVAGRLVVSVERADEILAEFGVRSRRGHLVDAPLAGDGNVEDSLAWDAPIGTRESIRERLLGTGSPYTLPSSAQPGTLLADIIGCEEPVPW